MLPSSRPRAVTTIVFPAPVSPVSTVRPGRNSISAASMIAKSRICRCVSMSVSPLVGVAAAAVLACDEAATNIVEHAYGGKGAKPHFVLALNCCKSRVTATFFDSGTSFDPREIAEPDIRKNLAGVKRGGYGVFLIRKLVDKIVYSARRRLNVTRLVKEVKA